MRWRAVIFFLVVVDSAASALPLFREETVGRMSRDLAVFVLVDSRVLLAVGRALVAALMAACFT